MALAQAVPPLYAALPEAVAAADVAALVEALRVFPGLEADADAPGPGALRALLRWSQRGVVPEEVAAAAAE